MTAPRSFLALQAPAAAAVLASWEPRLMGSASHAGPGALLAGIITNHRTAGLLLPPALPAHFFWGPLACRSPDPVCL